MFIDGLLVIDIIWIIICIIGVFIISFFSGFLGAIIYLLIWCLGLGKSKDIEQQTQGHSNDSEIDKDDESSEEDGFENSSVSDEEDEK